MKSIIFNEVVKNRYFILFTFVLSFFISCNTAKNDNSANKELAVYKVAMPDKQKKFNFAYPQVITLDATKSFHKLDFGVFSTESTIEIFESDNTKIPLIKQHLKPVEKQIVDISKLSRGIYRINFTAIAEGCAFLIELK